MLALTHSHGSDAMPSQSTWPDCAGRAASRLAPFAVMSISRVGALHIRKPPPFQAIRAGLPNAGNRGIDRRSNRPDMRMKSSWDSMVTLNSLSDAKVVPSSQHKRPVVVQRPREEAFHT